VNGDADAPLTRVASEQMFRNLHTIKGHARLLGLRHLVEAVHAAEEAFGAGRGARDAMPDRERLRTAHAAVTAVLEQYAEIGARRLGELGSGRDAWLDQLLVEVEAAAASAPGDGGLILRSVKRAAERARASSLGATVKDVARMLPSLARELAKAVPIVDQGGRDVALSHSWGTVMRDALVHVFRNAIDHGIESREERQERGKAPEGRISISADDGPDGLVVRIADDGRGLAVDSLRQKLGDAGASDEAIAERIFQSGVSSAAALSAVSGRGVGLDAVRTLVRQRGGDVQIRFRGERHGGDGTRPFELIFTLPADAMVTAQPTVPARPAALPASMVGPPRAL
jgi:chemotaxis protein histidine kinase CheA